MSILNNCEYFCINLDTRTDRWEKVQEQFEILQLNKNVVRKSAKVDVPIRNEKMSKGEHSLIETNLELFKNCPKDRNLCIFEDDVYFIEDIVSKDIFNKVMEQLPTDFGVLYLGAHLFDKKIKHPLISPNIVQMKPEPTPTPEKDHVYIGGAHAIIFSPIAVNYINSLTDDVLFEAPWDVFISKYLVPQNNCYMIYPPFAFQREDESDLEGKQTSRNWIIAHNEKKIIKGKFSKNPLVRLFHNFK